MNNEQFRRLLFDNSQPSSKPKNSPSPTSPQLPPNTRSHASPSGGPAGHALGSRMRSSIPMTPRTLTKPDFARQLAEYGRDEQNPHPNKKFKSSAAPKGTKLPAGYQDRAARLRELEGGNEEDKDKAEGAAKGTGSGSGLSAEGEQKLKILEMRFKKGVIDEATFLQRRRELGVGGDLSSTHMVKGLDWDLLRKVRAGEDVQRREKSEEEDEAAGERAEGEAEGQGEEKDEVDVDEEFDKVLDGNEEAALPSAPKEREKKKGSMAPPPAPAHTGRKTRDEILRELKASRAAAAAEAAAAAQENALGARFKKIGDSKVEKKRFIEQDENGRRREVLLITDAEGKTKRKTRWLDKPGQTAPAAAPAASDNEAKPLGMEVPAEIAAKAAEAKAAQEAEDEDDDIFAGVGADYDPLGDAGSDGDSSDSEEEEGEVATKQPAAQKAPTAEPAGEPTKPRNYFATAATQDEEKVESGRANPLTKDPVLLAAIKRAASLRQASGEDAAAAEGEDEEVDRDTLLRRKKFLEDARRREELDAMDIDYGFGGSRGADDEDDEEVILQDTRGGTKRKRGPKKKKGDKDSAADVLSVLEGRKKT
ncbi:hypothetical protein ASPCAL08615 [Aspergillus calidoustus]|uniref:RED-like N-terminal domain-containing protein n=1 Tax=Aspergillus calidoustus TaxID=454130 RepID=A0A0U5GT94_ASPCI|nr:hypothetical protein ASPCAL08615 [Aspergillus calidoustus]